jgi:hypothetical protein
LYQKKKEKKEKEKRQVARCIFCFILIKYKQYRDFKAFVKMLLRNLVNFKCSGSRCETYLHTGQILLRTRPNAHRQKELMMIAESDLLNIPRII